MPDPQIKLDAAQVREIVAANRSSKSLFDRIKKFETFALRGLVGERRSIFDGAHLLKAVEAGSRIVKRIDSFLQAGGIQLLDSGQQRTARRTAEIVGSALRGAQALSFIPIAGPIAGGIIGGALGTQIEPRRRQGDRQVLEVQNEQALAERELAKRLREDFLRRQRDHATGLFGPLGLHVRRARQGRAR